MPVTDSILIDDLNIDLQNYRTVPQVDELHAVRAMAAINPGRIWALMESLLEDGYLPTENILVLRTEEGLIVREGNRRIAALKIIYGLIEYAEIPENIRNLISNISDEWKASNRKIPCALYEKNESHIVDKIVALTHGKGQKAARDKWTAVATARHNRDVNKRKEVGLDILEKFLRGSKTIASQTKETWSGDYPLTVLDEFLKKYSSKIGFKSSVELSESYPDIENKGILDRIIADIGLGIVRFETIRNQANNFELRYQLDVYLDSTQRNHPEVVISSNYQSTESNDVSTGVGEPTTGQEKEEEKEKQSENTATGGEASQDVGDPQNESSQKSLPSSKPRAARSTRATASNDIRTVKKILKAFKPTGNDRHKIEALRIELTKLDLKVNPLAFCFLVRSLFEISAKQYCDEHKDKVNAPSYKKPKGDDKNLAQVLKEIKDYLTNNGKNKDLLHELHGAITELTTPERPLSVTSMNQLVHNPKFTISVDSVCTFFVNIYPMLEAMNQDE